MLIAAIGAWTAHYLADAIEALRAEGADVPDELLAHLSPVAWEPLHNLGYAALAGGQLDGAANLFADALEGNLHAADRRGGAECLIGIGATAAANGDAPRAVQLFGAGEARLAAANLELWPSNRRDYKRWRRVAAEILGGVAFERARSTGTGCRSMTLSR